MFETVPGTLVALPLVPRRAPVEVNRVQFEHAMARLVAELPRLPEPFLVRQGLSWASPGRQLGLSAEEVASLPTSRRPPSGYSWHHHQDVGRMQLVTDSAHDLGKPHTGGMAIWGGGY